MVSGAFVNINSVSSSCVFYWINVNNATGYKSAVLEQEEVTIIKTKHIYLSLPIQAVHVAKALPKRSRIFISTMLTLFVPWNGKVLHIRDFFLQCTTSRENIFLNKGHPGTGVLIFMILFCLLCTHSGGDDPYLRHGDLNDHLVVHGTPETNHTGRHANGFIAIVGTSVTLNSISTTSTQ